MGLTGKLAAFLLVLTLVSGCQAELARTGIPVAYALTGLCVALLVSPTPTAAVVGLVIGALLGAAIYNNSLKGQLLERRPIHG